MPTKLRVLFGMFFASVSINALLFITGKNANVGNVLISVGVAIALWKGFEGARVIIMWFAGVTTLYYAFMTTFLLMLVGTEPKVYLPLIAAHLFVVTVQGFTVWCLYQEDVVSWISRRRFGSFDVDEYVV